MKAFLPLLSLLSVAHALYFYIPGETPRCFFEELPKDTLVVGHYVSEEWDDQTNTWAAHPGINIYISVDASEVFNHNHRVLSQRGSTEGRFTFTAHEAGDHKICFMPISNTGHERWLNSHHQGVKISLDMVIGETSRLESTDKDRLNDLATRVKDLNARLGDVRREQVFQREREAQFRDQSEATNGRVIMWILVQMGVLAVTCVWQLSHLRNFFIKQKLT
ncbi:hypothetical protein S40285_01327 [Stachybotrys chlorohalonatus IBT 40285]|uniref:GOLD domain-containing protein n=1 Tax=Stachybotrys chlorohalonatus (strain IBT 40285) TaxID=1283841 RepID=A0A084QQV5_STAC4|nr:hypothetical protein S40285_01327 [Stachybotrys chlorohalonata IBT 40285]